MKRKDFFKSLGLGIGVLTIPRVTVSQPTPVIPNKFIKYDMNGKKLELGDLLLERTGGGRYKGTNFHSYCLWEYWGQHGSKGYYRYKGELEEFWHAESSRSVILDDRSRIPKWILEQYNNGFHQFDSFLGAGDVYAIMAEAHRNIYEFIRNSRG